MITLMDSGTTLRLRRWRGPVGGLAAAAVALVGPACGVGSPSTAHTEPSFELLVERGLETSGPTAHGCAGSTGIMSVELIPTALERTSRGETLEVTIGVSMVEPTAARVRYSYVVERADGGLLRDPELSDIIDVPDGTLRIPRREMFERDGDYVIRLLAAVRTAGGLEEANTFSLFLRVQNDEINGISQLTDWGPGAAHEEVMR
jgi:hypothetical protein